MKKNIIIPILLFTLFGVLQISTFAQSKVTSKNSPVSTYSDDPAIIAKGKTLFDLNCGTCHNFKQKGIGPNLGQVTTEAKKNYIVKFIKNSKAFIDKGDIRANKLFKEYNQMMPAFNYLPATDIEAIVSYINNQQKPITKSNRIDKTAITDPIVKKIQKSGLKLNLEYLTTAPATLDKIPLARINSMVVLHGPKTKLFLSDLRGIIYEVKGKTLNPYLDFKTLNPNFIHTPGLATGLGSYAFHPEFYNNGLFYTTHTEKADAAKADFAYNDSIKVTLQWVITEWKIKDPTADTFDGTSREIFRINMVSQIHGMQELVFNPFAKKGDADYGLLYVGIGDGGASENGYPFICNTQKNLWSSVIRIDPSGNNSKNGKYGIPADNPFKVDNVANEVFCRGFRNPNRIYWSPDGKMLISDIGHKNIEELNIGKPSADYGWPYREGTFVIKPEANMDQLFALPINDAKLNYKYPALQYDHQEGNAISAGFVYNSDAIPALKGKYVFGDVVNGRVFYVENNSLAQGKQAEIKELDLEINGKNVNFIDLCGNSKTDLRFGQGINGEVYLYTKTDGKMYMVVGCE
jgi:glucose/arabinose dehydrogenase/mono/diheme cytochrome c family protein